MATSSEFDLIETYFNWPSQVPVGVGDDAAVLHVPADKQLIITTDTLLSGVHFPTDTSPHAIGHKALAVNLSDLAAMGADCAWFTLALTLPEADEYWLEAFSSGLQPLAEQHHIVLVGGDTTKGPLSITITAMGLAEASNLMLRSGARHGDAIYVTGSLGDAAAGLAVLQKRLHLSSAEACINKLNYPQPRLSHSQIIRNFASACIDISDGFLADLGHILDKSSVGAVIDLNAIPLNAELISLPAEQAMPFALNGGDDYELLFTVPQQLCRQCERALDENGMLWYCVGHIDETVSGVCSSSGQVLDAKGYNHFRGTDS